MSDLAFLSAVELLEGYRQKAFSPVEVTRACLAHIERAGAALNAFVHVDAPHYRGEAMGDDPLPYPEPPDEAIRELVKRYLGPLRRALAREVYERVSVAGIALILVLMYIALNNDFSSGGPG